MEQPFFCSKACFTSKAITFCDSGDDGDDDDAHLLHLLLYS